MRRILIIGGSSYIGQHLAALMQVDTCSYRKALTINYREYDCVINCTFSPHYTDNHVFHPNKLVDVQIINSIAVDNPNCKYIMLSSMAVYEDAWSPDYTLLAEDSPKVPIGPVVKTYGEKKLFMEMYAQNNLTNYAILRLGNVVGIRTDGKTFAGFMQRSMITNNKIVLNTHPDTVKDFIPVSTLVSIVSRFAITDIRGVFNVGSGVPLTVSDAARTMASDYSQHVDIEQSNMATEGNWCLDVRYLKSRLAGTSIHRTHLLESFMNIGSHYNCHHHGVI